MVVRRTFTTCPHHTPMFISIYFCLLLFSSTASVEASSSGGDETIAVAEWHFSEFSIHITVCIFLVVVMIIKMIYHAFKWLSSNVPESFVLMLVGLLFAAIVKHLMKHDFFEESVWKLNPKLFFTYLLPPIILESAYSLYNRTFVEYIGAVLLFAVFGTILNFLLIGFGLYGIQAAGGFGTVGSLFNLKTLLLFSALIVAVDPVAVLAIFQDIGVEFGLYYIVFGESLLNDAITIVLYNIMDVFLATDEITAKKIGIGLASFFTVSLGGFIIGVILGILSCLFTRIHSRLNGLALLLIAYFSYIIADTVGWSGIIAMIGCGFVQAAYAFSNIDPSSHTFLREFTRQTSEISEAVIFLFLGVELIASELIWDTGFILFSILLCLIVRALVVLGLTAFTNWFNVVDTKISLAKQIILIYGGLRGAVAFSLSVLINPKKFHQDGERQVRLLVTTTLVIIIFTVGIMGLTIKPLVKFLKIRLQSKKLISLFDVLNENIIDEVTTIIERISGERGRNVSRDWFLKKADMHLRKLLQNEPDCRDESLMSVYEQITLKLHYAAMQPDKLDSILADLREPLREPLQDSGVVPFNRLSFIPQMVKRRLSSVYDTVTAPHVDVQEEEQDVGMPRRRKLSISEERDLVDALANTRSTRRVTIAPGSRTPIGFNTAMIDSLYVRQRAVGNLIGLDEIPNLDTRRTSVIMPRTSEMIVEDPLNDDQDGDDTPQVQLPSIGPNDDKQT